MGLCLMESVYDYFHGTLFAGATIGFNPSEYSTGEDGGSVTLRVELITGQLGRSVEVLLNTRDGTATGAYIYGYLVVAYMRTVELTYWRLSP